MQQSGRIRSSFVAWTWAILGFTVLVVLWGAYVRATGSGAGCGNHWPLCNGEIIPRSATATTLIEFTHRATSGLAFLGVLALLIWALRAFPTRHPVRWAAGASFFFMVTEALVGAGLVLFGLVEDNDSFHRAWVMAFHLVNTFFLLACLSLTAWWADHGTSARLSLRSSGLPGWLLLGGILLIGISGAVAALGDTLFPSDSLEEAIRADFSAESHILIRLRIYHPFLAIGAALPLAFMVLRSTRRESPMPSQTLAWITGGLFVLQLSIGVLNLVLLAPVWLQIVHLFCAVVLWISAVLLVACQGSAGHSRLAT